MPATSRIRPTSYTAIRSPTARRAASCSRSELSSVRGTSGRLLMIRRYLNVVHRWTGLLMAVFLTVAGLTGSILAFNSELERLISPQLFAKPRTDVSPLAFAELAERAAAQVPDGVVRGVTRVER